jgi:hypothetical protein
MKRCIDPKYSGLSEFVHSVPEIFFRQGELVYDTRNTIKLFRLNEFSINVKSFKKPILINCFVYKYLRKSKIASSRM